MADDERIYLGSKDQITEILDTDAFIIVTGDGIRKMTKAQVMEKLGINELKELFNQLKEDKANGSGLTTTQKSLMITLFRNMLSQSDMTDTVDELENSFNSTSGGDNSGENSGSEDGGEDTPSTPTTYTIKYNLTNATSSMSDTSITSGNSFTTTLTPNDGYTLGTVTVTMGGIDVTDSVYSDGVITVSSVSGNIVINVIGVEGGSATAWEDGVPYELTTVQGEFVSNTDGTFVVKEANVRTDYIPCYGAKWLGASSRGTHRYNAFYDVNKQFIKGFAWEATGTAYVEIPENACYFILSEQSTEFTRTFTPYKDVESTWEDGVPYELTFVENEYVSNGNFTTYNGWKRTDYMNCSHASKLTLSVSVGSYSAFYDMKKQYMNAKVIGTEVEVPCGACYFILSEANDKMDSLVVTPHA